MAVKVLNLVNIVAPSPYLTALQLPGGQTQDKIPRAWSADATEGPWPTGRELALGGVYLAPSSYVTAQKHGVRRGAFRLTHFEVDWRGAIC